MILPLIVALFLAQSPAPRELSQPVSQVSLRGRTRHVQGIDTDGVTLCVAAFDPSVHKSYLMASALKDGASSGPSSWKMVNAIIPAASTATPLPSGRDFYVWDHKGKLIRKAASTTLNSYQHLKWVSGSIVIGIHHAVNEAHQHPSGHQFGLAANNRVQQSRIPVG
jgi:hypothetical protein